MNFEASAPALPRNQQVRILMLAVGSVIALILAISGTKALLNRPEAPPPALPAGQLQLTAETSLGFATRQLELGAVGTYAVLSAKATAQTAPSQWITARMMRLSDSVGLFTALGGGVNAAEKTSSPQS